MTSPKRAELQYFVPVENITREEFLEMYPPKRAEPANEHADKMRMAAASLRGGNVDRGELADRCYAAAAEIERLAARVRELQEALTMKAFCEPEVTVIPRSDRPWLPIADAPRDGTRVELWVNNHKAGYGAWHYGAFRSDSGEKYCNPTHWRREPAGP